jgi:hypothetical protein
MIQHISPISNIISPNTFWQWEITFKEKKLRIALTIYKKGWLIL